MNEIEEVIKKIFKLLCSRIGRLNIVKMLMLPKVIFSFNAIPINIKILMTFFTDRKKNPEIYVEPQRTQNSQSYPKKKEQNWRNYIT